MKTKEQQIADLEVKIRNVFNNEVVNDMSVVIGNDLIAKWKKLTNWVEATENPIAQYKTI